MNDPHTERAERDGTDRRAAKLANYRDHYGVVAPPGSPTGRLSSSEPEMQTLRSSPRLTHEPIVDTDFAEIERRVLARARAL